MLGRGTVISRTVAIALFCACLAVLGVSVSVLVAGSRQAAVPPPTAQALLREAERAVPPPALPPAPPNALIERREALISRSIRVPAPAGAAAARLEAPQVVQQRVERPSISGASPQDAAAWEAEVERRQAAHDQAIEAALKRLEDQAKANEAAKSQGGFGSVSGMVAILGAVAGLLGAVATLVGALKGKPA